jgi:hypothetical protein
MSVERPDKARTRNFSLPASSVEAGFEDREGDRNGILLDRRHAIMDASSEILPRLRIAGGVLRGLFIVSLLIVTMHVCMPQREHVWTAYASPADLIRMILGFVVCVWLAIQLFNMPRDAQAYRTWSYLS